METTTTVTGDEIVQPLIIVGAGGLGREVAWLVEDINQESPRYELLGFLDDATTSTAEGYPVISSVHAWLETPDPRVRVVCAIGDPLTRFRIVRRFKEAGISFATLIHPTARHSRWVEFGPGTIVCADTILTTNIKVGAHSMFNLDCTVGHDTKLGDFTSLMPGVHVSGDVVVGTGTYFGTGATVINQVSIGDWTTVGAGAVVAKDLPSGVIAVGVPAKPIKDNPRVPSETELREP